MTTTTVAAGRKPIASRWIGATFVGWSAGFVLSILLLVAVESLGLRSTQFPLALGMGFGVGFAQARVLAPALGGRRSWVAASALGLTAPFLVTDALQAFGVPVPYSLFACIALGGAFAGILQARILARATGRAWWWAAGAALGWTLGASAGFVADRFQPPGITGLSGALMYVTIVLLGGVALGAVGAAVLHRILDEPLSSPAAGVGGYR